MNTTRKLLLVAVTGLIAISLSSCFVRRSPDHKWIKKRDRAYYYKMNGGRRLWVRDQFRNTH